MGSCNLKTFYMKNISFNATTIGKFKKVFNIIFVTLLKARRSFRLFQFYTPKFYFYQCFSTLFLYHKF